MRKCLYLKVEWDAIALAKNILAMTEAMLAQQAGDDNPNQYLAADLLAKLAPFEKEIGELWAEAERKW